MDKSTLLFAFFLGIAIGLFLGVYLLAKTALWERERIKARYYQRGWEDAQVEPAIGQLRQKTRLWRVK